MVNIYEHAVSIAVAAFVSAIPYIAILPIVDTIAMTLALVELADLHIAIGINLFLETIWRLALLA